MPTDRTAEVNALLARYASPNARPTDTPQAEAYRQNLRDNCRTCDLRRNPDGALYGPPHVPATPNHAPHCSCDGCY